MSFKENRKRTDFLRTVTDQDHKTRLYDCINKDHFWKLAKHLGYEKSN